MIQRISRKKYKVYAFDIESHNDSESIANKETSMWLGYLIDETSKVDSEECIFYDMPSVLNRLKELSNPKRSKDKNEKRPVKNVCVYIYNLSFEWSFILPELLKMGFTFKDRIDDEDELVFNSVSTKSCSSVWQVQMKFNAKGGMILFRDLAKIYGGGLGKVAKAFGLPTQKGEIDYRKNRLHNYVVTDEEKEYCFKDTKVLMDILEIMSKKNDRSFWNSVSMASYSMKELIKRGWPRSVKPYGEFRKLYPELDQEETDFLRKGVSGGITYAPDRFQFKEMNCIMAHIDAHQMHPSSAFFNLFPYGNGEYFTGKPPLGRICACRIRISYDDVKLHSIISLIGINFITDRELVVWDFEIATMKECYVNLEIEYIDGYAYKSRPLIWRRYYSDNYSKRLEARANHDTFNELYYKLLNNSSYGKLLEKPHNETFVNTLNAFDIIDSEVIEKAPDDIKVNSRYTYLPVGSCIPAYSRVALIELALKIGWKKILYFDTDSIFFIWDKETKAVWDKVDHTDWLGGWAMEEMLDKAQFLAPKRYKTTNTDGKTIIKAGGINFNSFKAEKISKKDKNFNNLSLSEQQEMINNYQIPFEEINLVNSSFKVQRAYRVKGGTIIEFQDKEVGIQKKYIDIYNRNINNEYIDGETK